MGSKPDLENECTALTNKHQDAFMTFLIKLDYSKLHLLYSQMKREVSLLNPGPCKQVSYLRVIPCSFTFTQHQQQPTCSPGQYIHAASVSIPQPVSCSDLPVQAALCSRGYTGSWDSEQPFSLATQTEVVQASV